MHGAAGLLQKCAVANSWAPFRTAHGLTANTAAQFVYESLTATTFAAITRFPLNKTKNSHTRAHSDGIELHSEEREKLKLGPLGSLGVMVSSYSIWSIWRVVPQIFTTKVSKMLACLMSRYMAVKCQHGRAQSDCARNKESVKKWQVAVNNNNNQFYRNTS